MMMKKTESPASQAIVESLDGLAVNLLGSWTTYIREILPVYSQMGLLEAGLGQSS